MDFRMSLRFCIASLGFRIKNKYSTVCIMLPPEPTNSISVFGQLKNAPASACWSVSALTSSCLPEKNMWLVTCQHEHIETPKFTWRNICLRDIRHASLSKIMLLHSACHAAVNGQSFQSKVYNIFRRSVFSDTLGICRFCVLSSNSSFNIFRYFTTALDELCRHPDRVGLILCTVAENDVQTAEQASPILAEQICRWEFNVR